MRVYPSVNLIIMRRNAIQVAHLIAKACWSANEEFEVQQDNIGLPSNIADLIIVESLL